MLRLVFALVLLLAIPVHPVLTAGPVLLHVDDNASAGGNGSGKSPFRNLPEAVEAANLLSGDIVIRVQPGDYLLSSPLVIARSLELRGSTVQLADSDLLPTGGVVSGTETRILGTSALGSQTMILVEGSEGAIVRDVTIRGFVIRSTASSTSVLLNRAQNFQIADNFFGGPAGFGLQTVASSGRASGNYFSGVGTGAIFAGGYAESPSNVDVIGNRAVGNSTGGVLLNGASINIPELGDQLHAVVRGNDLSGNTVNPLMAFGLRLFILRRDPNALGATQASGNISAIVQDNRIVGNRFGLLIDAGFPYRRFMGVCDPRVFSGSIDLMLRGNTLSDSLATDALVTFTRSTTAVNQAMLSDFQYLHGTTYAITDLDGTLANAWVDHPETDPFLGTCDGDATHEALGNFLFYNGAMVDYVRNF